MKPKRLGIGDKSSISGDPQDLGLNERSSIDHHQKIRGETSFLNSARLSRRAQSSQIAARSRPARVTGVM